MKRIAIFLMLASASVSADGRSDDLAGRIHCWTERYGTICTLDGHLSDKFSQCHVSTGRGCRVQGRALSARG